MHKDIEVTDEMFEVAEEIIILMSKKLTPNQAQAVIGMIQGTMIETAESYYKQK